MSTPSKHADSDVQTAIDDMHARLQAVRVEKKNPFVDLIVDRFVKGARPFCPGIFHPQDVSSVDQRKADLIGGWPYTSADYPWPQTGVGSLWMQPLVQLRLSRVGELFGAQIGDGLLQVWGPAFKDFESVVKPWDSPFITRHIPAEALQTAPSEFIPETMAWDNGHFKSNSADIQLLLNPSEDSEFIHSPVVEWQAARPMYGVYCHLYDVLTLDEQEDMGGSDAYWPIAEEIAERLSSSPLSMSQHAVYLGGLGGAAGGAEDPSFGKPLLLRMHDGNGFHFAITLKLNKSQKLEYVPVFRVRS